MLMIWVEMEQHGYFWMADWQIFYCCHQVNGFQLVLYVGFQVEVSLNVSIYILRFSKLKQNNKSLSSKNKTN